LQRDHCACWQQTATTQHENATLRPEDCQARNHFFGGLLHVDSEMGIQVNGLCINSSGMKNSSGGTAWLSQSLPSSAECFAAFDLFTMK
jgi:hypothetical protein